MFLGAASADVSYMCGDFRRRLNATRGAHESPAPASASAAAAEAAAMAVAGASGVNSVDAAVPRLGSGAYFDAEKMDAAFASSPLVAVMNRPHVKCAFAISGVKASGSAKTSRSGARGA